MIPKIVCGVCKQQVSSVSYHYRQEMDDYIFTANCHGKFERQVMPRMFLEDGWKILSMQAFKVNTPPFVIEGSCVELSSTSNIPKEEVLPSILPEPKEEVIML